MSSDQGPTPPDIPGSKQMPVKYKFRDMKVHSSDEWMAGGTKKYRKVFDRFETTYMRVEFSFSTNYLTKRIGRHRSGQKAIFSMAVRKMNCPIGRRNARSPKMKTLSISVIPGAMQHRAIIGAKEIMYGKAISMM